VGPARQHLHNLRTGLRHIRRRHPRPRPSHQGPPRSGSHPQRPASKPRRNPDAPRAAQVGAGQEGEDDGGGHGADALSTGSGRLSAGGVRTRLAGSVGSASSGEVATRARTVAVKASVITGGGGGVVVALSPLCPPLPPQAASSTALQRRASDFMMPSLLL